MLAVLLLSAVVAAAYADPVAIQPHGKAVIHETAKHIHKPVHLLQQVPVKHTKVHTIYNEVPRIVKKVKMIRKTRVHRKFYHVDQPIIRKTTHIKPVVLKRPKPYLKHVFVPTPVHRVKTIKVPVGVDVPVPEVKVKKVVKYHENKILKPVPIVKDRVRIVTVNKPFPVDRVVVQHEPRPRVVLNKRKINVVRTIHHIQNQPVPVHNVKTVKVEVPHIVKKKIPYPVVKLHNHGHFESGGYGDVAVHEQAGAVVEGGAIVEGREEVMEEPAVAVGYRTQKIKVLKSGQIVAKV